MDIDYFHTSMELKTVNVAERTIAGYAAIHHSVDRVRDVIDPSASVKAVARLKDPSKDVGVFIGHDTSKLSIGYPKHIEVTPKGLYTETYVWKGPDGDNLLAVAKDMLDHGHALGQSIGYNTVDSRREQNGNKMVRRLMDYALREYSYAAPQVIAHPDALVTGVKSRRQKALSEGSDTAGGALVPAQLGSQSATQKGAGMQYRVDQDVVAGTWTVLCDRDADGDADDNVPMGTYQSEEMANAVATALQLQARQQGEDEADEPAESVTGSDGKTLPVVEGEQKAVWSTKYVNDLEDKCFLFIEQGGVKDAEGKTTPRDKRHFPYRDAEGKLDLAHVRDAIGRIPQSAAPGLDDAKKAQLQARARRLLETASAGKTYEEASEWKAGAPLSVQGLAYRLLDISEQMADELKAMRLLGEETKDNLRIRPAVRDQLAAVAADITKAVEWAAMIDTGHDEKAYIARVQAEFDLLAL